MRYHFYLRVCLQEDNCIKIGDSHEIRWDERDLIKASSGWFIVNQEKIGMASDLVPRLYKGIMELRNSTETYKDYEMALGLGTINNVLTFYEELLKDCQKYPYTELCGGIAG